MNRTLRKLLMILMALGFLAGLCVLIYPLFSNAWNDYREKQLFDAWKSISEQEKDEEEEDRFAAQWQQAWEYNKDLSPIIIPDSFVQAEDPANLDPEYYASLDLNGDGKMGYIYIPKIDVRIPIYHTTGESVLEKGAGHLHGSSLPVGGESSHAVLAAHRGLPGMSLFTDVDQLTAGDTFYLYILDDVLAYEVDQILTVLPHETDSLQVEPGEDLITLVTCTPYGVNSHRLLVRGHRVEYTREKVAEQERQFVRSTNTNYFLWVAIGLGATLVLLLPVWILTGKSGKRRRKRIPENDRRAEIPRSRPAPGTAHPEATTAEPRRQEPDVTPRGRHEAPGREPDGSGERMRDAEGGDPLRMPVRRGKHEKS